MADVPYFKFCSTAFSWKDFLSSYVVNLTRDLSAKFISTQGRERHLLLKTKQNKTQLKAVSPQSLLCRLAVSVAGEAETGGSKVLDLAGLWGEIKDSLGNLMRLETLTPNYKVKGGLGTQLNGRVLAEMCRALDSIPRTVLLSM